VFRVDEDGDRQNPQIRAFVCVVASMKSRHYGTYNLMITFR